MAGHSKMATQALVVGELSVRLNQWTHSLIRAAFVVQIKTNVDYTLNKT